MIPEVTRQGLDSSPLPPRTTDPALDISTNNPAPRRVLTELRRIRGHRHGKARRAGVDAATVEAERYEAIYGRRMGTVQNVVPVEYVSRPSGTNRPARP